MKSNVGAMLAELTVLVVPLAHSGQAQSLSRTGPQVQAEEVPEVLFPGSLLVPEDTQANSVRGES